MIVSAGARSDIPLGTRLASSTHGDAVEVAQAELDALIEERFAKATQGKRLVRDAISQRD